MFLQSKNIVYQQYNQKFVENLSIIDLMMFNSRDRIKEFLQEFYLE